MHYRTDRHRARGFTLTELLVATMLLSVVMASVYTLFHATLNTWRNVEEDFDSYQDARNAVSIIESEVANILAQAEHLLEGGPHEVTLFVIAPPMNVEDSEGAHLMRVRYYVRRNGRKRSLMREERLVETALPIRPRRHWELDRQRIKLKAAKNFLIADNVRDFQVRYIWMPLPERATEYGRPPPRIKPVIADRHRERWGLPDAIEIELTLYDPQLLTEALTITSTMPVRAPIRRRSVMELKSMGVL